jgi:dipeptidyl aminopeptidase/acylaminoacyl peptidase
MKSDRRFEEDLPRLLEDLYLGPMPSYRDHLLQHTARTRQRRAWSIPGRWLPLVDITRQPVLVARVPWRMIGLGLALIAVLVGMVAALIVGGRPHLPAPFGLARNGLVAYASGGDIHTVDPVTGSSTAIVRGPETDLNPRWSRDGTRLAFERKSGGDSSPGLVYVARADGADVVQVTPGPLSNITNYDFSPDGKKLLISAEITGMVGTTIGGPGMFIAATDGGGIRQLDVGMPATNAAWRPPDGADILFMDAGDSANGYGSIHLVSADGGPVRTILATVAGSGRYRGNPAWSPDGSLVSYGEWTDSASLTVQTHVMAADGTGDRTLPIPDAAAWQAPYGWSNDGTRLLLIRGYSGGVDQARPVAIPVDGSGTGIEIPYPGGMENTSPSDWEWAPDDSVILGTPADASGNLLDQVLLDPVGGTSRTLPWASVSRPSWQRLAP